MKLNFAFFVFAVFAAPVTLAEVYVYSDQDGVTHYTNVRPAGRHKVDRVIREPRGSVVRVAGSARPMSAEAVREIVKQASSALNVDHRLVHAVIQTESAFDAHAVSVKGASGLMQLMPDTAARYGVRNLFDPEQNIWGGVQYLRDLLVRFNDDVPLALAAYNAGENAVLRHGGIPPYAETRNYVKRVVALQRRFQGS